MEVRWRGHSCFELIESTGTVVLMDPYPKAVTGNMKPDVVTVSHPHDNHSGRPLSEGKYVLLKEAEALEDYKGVSIVGIKSFHDNQQGAVLGENIVFKVRIDGLDVCHLGDIGQDCDAEILSDILPVDVLLVPVGGDDTLDAGQAKEYIEALMPSVVIPMHYRTAGHRDLDKLSVFLKLFDEEQIVEIEESSLELNRDDLQPEVTQVYVLTKYNG